MAILIALAALECSPPQRPGPSTVSLRMRGAPLGATVVIDDEPVGSLDFVAAHGVALPPGKHSVTVIARGYLPMDREVDAKPGAQPILLVIALTPVPD